MIMDWKRLWESNDSDGEESKYFDCGWESKGEAMPIISIKGSIKRNWIPIFLYYLKKTIKNENRLYKSKYKQNLLFRLFKIYI